MNATMIDTIRPGKKMWSIMLVPHIFTHILLQLSYITNCTIGCPLLSYRPTVFFSTTYSLPPGMELGLGVRGGRSINKKQHLL